MLSSLGACIIQYQVLREHAIFTATRMALLHNVFLNFENHHISNNTLCKKVCVYKCTYKRIHVFGIIIWMHRLNNFRKHCINWSLLDFGWQIFWKFLFSSSTNDHFNFFDCKCGLRVPVPRNMTSYCPSSATTWSTTICVSL